MFFQIHTLSHKKRITMCLQMKTKIRKVYRLRMKQYARDRVTKFKNQQRGHMLKQAANVGPRWIQWNPEMVPRNGARVLPSEVVPVPGHSAQIFARARKKGHRFANSTATFE